jgi:hypothetical protein
MKPKSLLVLLCAIVLTAQSREANGLGEMTGLHRVAHQMNLTASMAETVSI